MTERAGGGDGLESRETGRGALGWRQLLREVKGGEAEALGRRKSVSGRSWVPTPGRRVTQPHIFSLLGTGPRIFTYGTEVEIAK